MFDPIYHKWISIGVVVLVLIGIVWEKYKASIVFSAGVIVLLFSGVLDIHDYLNSFANESILIIFLLIFITAGIKDNFNLIGWFDKVFKRAKSSKAFIFQMSSMVALLSSIMNNTPIVALLTPYVYQWSKKHEVAPSKLLIPLSYAAILGGVITVIGTSTNLVLNGFLEANNESMLSTMDYLIPGLLVTIAGVVYMCFTFNRLLPNRNDAITELEHNTRNYLLESRVKVGSDIEGKSVLEAGFRNLKDAFLVQVIRGVEVISPVEPGFKLKGEDKLYFAGNTDKILSLVKANQGLTWGKIDDFSLGDDLKLAEVIIPRNSDLIGKTLKSSTFREKYDAAAVAIHRNGKILSGKLGELSLEIGDLLLIVAGKEFAQRSNRDKNLYLVSILEQWKSKPTKGKSWFVVLSILVLLGVFFQVCTFSLALLVIFALMGVFKLFGTSDLKKNLNIDLLVILGGALTIGKSIIDTGAAEFLGTHFLELVLPYGARVVVIFVFLLTLLLTTFITNVAAVSIMFPLVYQIGISMRGDASYLYLTIAFAASAAFLTPISYQTNLIVLGPGGYKFRDFMKFGLPMTMVYSLIFFTYLFLFKL